MVIVMFLANCRAVFFLILKFFVDLSVEGGGTLPPKSYKLMRTYPVKENQIGSAVSEILLYRHTDKHTFCYFIIRI